MKWTISLRRQRTVSVAAVALLVLAGLNANAKAAVILTFGQIGTGRPVTSVNNGLGLTTLTSTDAPIFVTGFLGGGTPFSALFNFSAHSVGAAFTDGLGQIHQNFT